MEPQVQPMARKARAMPTSMISVKLNSSSLKLQICLGLECHQKLERWLLLPNAKRMTMKVGAMQALS